MRDLVVALTTRPRSRFAFSVLGCALCALLMLFLLGVYRGVADGSLDYIRDSQPDLWVLHKNANNILRGQSVLQPGLERQLVAHEQIQTASPILLLLARAECRDGWASVYLVGYDPAAELGGPPRLVAGRGIRSDREIVIDQAFAAKWDYGLGDTLVIQESPLIVVGLSDGTNAFVIQYAFVSLHQAQVLLDLIPIVSCYLIQTVPGTDETRLASQLEGEFTTIAAYEQQAFVANNTQEMQAGFLPFVLTIAGIGSIVLTTLLTLLLSISVLESRQDLATLKVLGAQRGFLPRVVLGQSILIAVCGVVLGLALFFPLLWLVGTLSPEVAVRPSAIESSLVILGVIGAGLVSAATAVHRLRTIHALEAFT